MEKTNLLLDGTSKRVYATDNPGLLIQEFKDDQAAHGGQKKTVIPGKGAANNKISAKLFEVLESKGVSTHFVKTAGESEMLVKKLDMIPIEVTIRNIVAGGMSRLLGIEEGRALKEPVLEFHYKNDALCDPLINEYHIKALELAKEKELDVIRKRSFEVNNIMKIFFNERGLDLVDFKIEFGRIKGKLIVGDELSMDTARVWEKRTGRRLDKEGALETYNEMLAIVLGSKQ
jgi:phosphoribosylaminoimidazole-succinocarboxamide synthase